MENFGGFETFRLVFSDSMQRLQTGMSGVEGGSVSTSDVVHDEDLHAVEGNERGESKTF